MHSSRLAAVVLLGAATTALALAQPTQPQPAPSKTIAAEKIRLPGTATAQPAASTFSRGLEAAVGAATTAPPQPLAPGRTLVPVDWGGVQEAIKNQRLQRTAFRKMEVAPGGAPPTLPVLLPSEPALTTTAETHVFPRRDSYAASLKQGDIVIEVHGERRALVIEPADPLARSMQKQATTTIAGAAAPFAVERTEGGYDLTFNRFGAAYLVSVECANPETDERCTKPDYVQKLAQEIALIGQDHP